jgi:DNA repair protein RadA/Sms
VAKLKTIFTCSACGHVSARWLGRCPQCEAWNSLVEGTAPATTRAAKAGARPRSANGPMRLGDVSGSRVSRMQSGIKEFDALLGGGLVEGSLVLLGGPPGAGKSTLLLQVANALVARGSTTL